MHLNLAKLTLLWNNGNPNLPAASPAIRRFNRVQQWVEELQKLQIAIEDTQTVRIQGIPIKASTRFFGPIEDDLLTANRHACLTNIKAHFTEYPDIPRLVEQCWNLLSGTEDGKIHSEFRILSNTVHSKSDLGSLTSSGVSQKPNSNFTSNNYFFQIARFLQACQGQQQLTLDTCNGLQSKRAGLAISAFLGPHSVPLSPCSGPHYLPLRLQSSASACNPPLPDHISCH